MNPTPFWRDKRMIPILLQAAFIFVVVLVCYYLINNALSGLRRAGIPFGFGFINSTASFDISGDKLIDYSATDSYGRAVAVGFLNTLRVAFLGIFLASIIGITLGVARLSNNWLARNVSKSFIEIFRNTPLLVQMIIWYSAVFLALPRIENSYTFSNSVYFSNRGIAIPWISITEATWIWLGFLGVGIVISVVAWKKRMNTQIEGGNRTYPFMWASIILFAALLIPYLITFQGPFATNIPFLNPNGRGFIDGIVISPSFAAVLIALVMYTSAFIAEIVRAGITGIDKGQVEAAQSLGLKNSTALRLIIFPQAFRIIIPPMTSQYLNLTKNSSLAVAVGYPELVSVSNTILNQSGRAIEMISIMILCYLSFSLITSVLMNIFNKYAQLKER